MANRREFEKYYYFMIISGVVILLADIYYYAHPLWRSMGWTHEIPDSLMFRLRSGGVFVAPWKSKAVALLLLSGTLLTRSGKGMKVPLWISLSVLGIGLLLYFFAPTGHPLRFVIMTLCGSVFSCWGLGMAGRKLGHFHEAVNDRNETFAQCETLIDTPDSFNLKTKYYYQGRWRDGWINCVSPDRGTLVMGVPGSGKSFSIIEPALEQLIAKGNAMFVYDYKYPALTEIVYNDLLLHKDAYSVMPEFCVISFKDPQYSLRCNPINPRTITDPSDTSEVAEIVMLNVNRNAVEKEDFFSMSAKLYLDAIIWFLRNYEGGKYCTFPHAIQFMSEDYKKTFKIMSTSDIPGLEFKIKSFVNAMEGNAQDQLQGQIASAQIPLGRFISPQLYWVLSGDDISLDINNPEHPKILCVGNDPQRQAIYGTTLALITSRLLRRINVPDMLRCGVIIDEFPTIYMKGIDNVIDTARSNRVRVMLACQDKSQIIRDYAEKEAKVIFNTVGNIFSGQVNGETAEDLSKMFGREFRRRESQTRSIESDSINVSFQQEELMPRSYIETLTQGVFLGKVADTYEHQIQQKLFCGKVIIDMDEYKAKKKNRKPLPLMTDFGSDAVRQSVFSNPEEYLMEYFMETMSEDRSVLYAQDEISCICREKVESLTASESAQLLERIASAKEKGNIDKIINDNFLKIQQDIRYIIDKETHKANQAASCAKPSAAIAAISPMTVDPFAD